MIRRLILLFLLLAVAGCVHQPPEESRDRARALLAARGLDAEWGRSPRPAAVPAQSLTRTDAVRLGLQRNPALLVTLADLDIAAADYEAAVNGVAPRLALSWRDSSAPGAAAEWTIGIADQLARWLLWRPNRRAADAELEAARWRAAAEIQSLADRIERVWHACAAALERRSIGAQRAQLASAAAELAERYHAAGNISAAERDLRIADAALAVSQAADADLAATESRAALGRLMGLRPDPSWSIAAEAAVPGAASAALLAPDELRARARANRLDLGEARARVAATAERARRAGLRALAEQTEIGVERTRDVDRSRLLGPTLSLPVPGFGTTTVAARRAGAEWRRAQSRLEMLELEVDYGIDVARQRHETARQRALRWREQALPALQRRLEARQREQNFMLIGPFELFEDRDRLLAGELERVDAEQAYWDARLDLEREIGARLPEAESGVEPPPAAAEAPPATPTSPPVAAPPAQDHAHQH